MMNPTVGRIVYYKNGTQIHAGIITYVWAENCVNLALFDANGNSYNKTSVLNGQNDGQWDWMPYQKQKASAGDHNSESAEPRPNEVKNE